MPHYIAAHAVRCFEIFFFSSCYNIFNMAEQRLREITWEAPEHHHTEKGSDWFWAVGIIAVTGAGAAIVFSNILFGIVILLGATILAIVSARGPGIIPYSISTRGIRVNDVLFPYSSLEAFYINEDDPRGVQLYVRSDRVFMPLIVMQLPEEFLEEIEELLEERLPEEHMEESLGHLILEFLGF